MILSLTSGAQSSAVSVNLHNVHLFGRTGMIGERETGLVYKDEFRADQICRRYQKRPRKVIGFNEVWDDLLASDMIQSLKPTYPYAVRSPSARGIQEILDVLKKRWPRSSGLIAERTSDIVDYLAKSHYHADASFWWSAVRYCVKEDWLIWALEHSLKLPQFLGAGLLLLSQYPIVSSEFIPYPAKADLERLIGKGILKAVIQPPEGGRFVVLITHLQEGNSPEAVEARRRQVLQLKKEKAASLYPVIVIMDSNIRADTTAEYFRTKNRLDMDDVFRILHPDARAEPGYTYEHCNSKNPYSAKLGVRSAPDQEPQRIDMIYSQGFRPVFCRVAAEEFISDDGDYFLADHHAVSATLVPILEGAESPV